MLFQMPNAAPARNRPEGWRCVGCGAQIHGTELDLPSFCVFCKAWATWRREGDEAWARTLGKEGLEAKGIWLVDFDNGSGYYCWRYPEDSLQFYHSYEDGFQGRMRIQ